MCGIPTWHMNQTKTRTHERTLAFLELLVGAKNLLRMVPSTCPAKKIVGGQQEEGHLVVHPVQGEYHETSMLQDASRMQDRQIQCRTD